MEKRLKAETGQRREYAMACQPSRAPEEEGSSEYAEEDRRCEVEQ